MRNNKIISEYIKKSRNENEDNSNSNNKNSNGDDFNYNNVLQRNTYYKHRRGFILSFRVNLSELEILDKLIVLRRKNASEVIREAIAVYYGILSNTKKINVDSIVVNNPVVNININETETERKIGKNEDIDMDVLMNQVDILNRENRMLKKQVEYYKNEYEKIRVELESIKNRKAETEYKYRIIDIDKDKIANSLDLIIDSIKENRIDQALEWLQKLKNMLRE